jgi:hypothetical protein
MYPDVTYNARPAPIHRGDWDAAGPSTVELTSSGYAELRRQSAGQVAGQAKLAAPTTPATFIATSGAGVLLLLGIALYLDRRA